MPVSTCVCDSAEYHEHADITFACGHTILKCVNEDAYGNFDMTDIGEDYKRYASDKDCGDGGDLLTCIQKQSLNGCQRGVLLLCEKTARAAIVVHVEASQHALNARLHFEFEEIQEFGIVPSNRTRNGLELETAKERVDMLESGSWNELQKAFEKCGREILDLKTKKCPSKKLDRALCAASCTRAIDHWLLSVHAEYTHAVDDFFLQVINCYPAHVDMIK